MCSRQARRQAAKRQCLLLHSTITGDENLTSLRSADSAVVSCTIAQDNGKIQNSTLKSLGSSKNHLAARTIARTMYGSAPRMTEQQPPRRVCSQYSRRQTASKAVSAATCKCDLRHRFSFFYILVVLDMHDECFRSSQCQLCG